MLYNLLESDKESPKGIWAVKITRELWKRQIWTDARAVEVMRLASLSDNEKVITGGVRFFLGGDKEREEAAEESVKHVEVLVDLRRAFPDGVVEEIEEKIANWNQDFANENPFADINHGKGSICRGNVFIKFVLIKCF